MTGPTCDYAACHRPPTAREDGWAFCTRHLTEHRREKRTDPAPPRTRRPTPLSVIVACLHAQGLTDRRIADATPCALDTARRMRWELGLQPNPAPRRIAQCGTRSGFDRHKRLGEPIDEACREAERIYQRERGRWRRARARAARLVSAATSRQAS